MIHILFYGNWTFFWICPVASSGQRKTRKNTQAALSAEVAELKEHVKDICPRHFPGGPAKTLPGGEAAWQIHWPTLFLHCCEVKQALNMLGRAEMEVVVQHQVASVQLLRRCFTEYSGHEAFMVILVRHAMIARPRLKGKQSPYEDANHEGDAAFSAK